MCVYICILLGPLGTLLGPLGASWGFPGAPRGPRELPKRATEGHQEGPMGRAPTDGRTGGGWERVNNLAAMVMQDMEAPSRTGSRPPLCSGTATDGFFCWWWQARARNPREPPSSSTSSFGFPPTFSSSSSPSSPYLLLRDYHGFVGAIHSAWQCRCRVEGDLTPPRFSWICGRHPLNMAMPLQNGGRFKRVRECKGGTRM